MLYIFLILLILIALGIAENMLHQRRLDHIPIRILVNGTRGKTSVSRILAEVLNEKGIRTLCRTTGSAAELLFPSGKTEPFTRKRGGAKITELIRFIRLAERENVECVVVECMALVPENQKIISEKLVRPTHIIITNAYTDHVAEMGPSEEDTVEALRKCILRSSKVYSPDPRFDCGCASFALVQDSFSEPGGDEGISTHGINLSLVLALAVEFGLKREDVILASKKAKPDIGLHRSFKGKNGALFLPHFSINDLTCMKNAIAECGKSGKTLYLIFNNRHDREYRIMLFCDAINGSGAKIETVFTIGDYPEKAARYLKRHSKTDAEPLSGADELIRMIDGAGETSLFLALGNIKGEGESLVSMFLKRENS